MRRHRFPRPIGAFTLVELLVVIKSGGGIGTQNAATTIAKSLTCPSSNRPKNPTSGLSVDYTYNSNLGDDRAYPWSVQYNPSTAAWGLFKKANQVPQNVIIA